MIEVTVVNQQNDVEVDGQAIMCFVQALADETRSEADEVSVAILKDSEVRALNRVYRGIDRVTDVLSFPLNEDKTPEGKRNLGDLIICASRAEEQARRSGHDTWTEFRILMIHGFLHLLGLDHPEQPTAVRHSGDEESGPMELEEARLRTNLIEKSLEETGCSGE